MKKVLISIAVLFLMSAINAQNYKFGKISKEELQEKVYPLDSSANAAFLYKKRNTYFRYIQNEGFFVDTEIQERIKIYNKEGYEWATKRIKYYNPDKGEEERISGIDARTYIIESGKVKSIKMKKNQIFTEKNNKYWSQKKFTLPNISDGCIVEWKYKISSPYRSINKVQLQHSIPIKKIECRISIPEYYNFNVKQSGYLPINTDKSYERGNITLSFKRRTTTRNVTSTSYSNENIDFTNNVTKIETEDVPAIIKEAFVDNIDNYKSSLNFELASVKWPNEPVKLYSQSWEDVAKTLYKDSGFGAELKKRNYFKEDLAQILSKTTGDEQKMLAIFEFVKSKIKWNDYYGLTTDEGVRSAYKNGVGNIADINLILTAMLKEAGVNANPVMLSTRNHGIPIFPTLSGLNYVISAVKINENYVLLDASEKYTKPNILPERAINWQGIIVGDNGFYEVISLTNLPKAQISSIVTVKIDEEGELSGMSRSQYSNYYSMLYRNAFNSLSEDELVSKIEESNDDIEIENIRISNKENVYKGLIEMYSFNAEDMTSVSSDKIYMKPMLFNSITENKFKLENREYPVDFTTSSVKKYSISIEIPEGYTIESMPEKIAIGLPENLGVYKFIISNTGNKINIISQLSINTVIYPVQYYQELKEFYKQIVKKNAEQIILKKV